MRRLCILITVGAAGLIAALALGGNPSGLTLVTTGSSTLKVSWTPTPGALGYVMVVDGLWVSYTKNGSMSSTTFGKAPGAGSHRYEVIAIDPVFGATIVYPAPPTPVAGYGQGGVGHPVAAVPTTYVAQTAAGNSSGLTCANARSVATSNATTYKPGDVVGICGTVTAQMTLRGSGTAALPITWVFMPGAKISMPVCPRYGCINIDGAVAAGGPVAYVTIDGGTDGLIENTANGTGLANQTSATSAIAIGHTDHVTIQNLQLRNLYQHTSKADASIASKEQFAILSDENNNLRVTYTTIHDSQLGINYLTLPGYGVGNEVDHTEFYNVDNPVNQTYSFNGGTTGPFLFDHNYAHDFGAWDSTANAYHHDGVHCYTSTGNATDAVHSVGNYYFDNRFATGATASNMNTFLYLEGNLGSLCDDASSPNYIFNNVFVDQTTGTIADGEIAPFAGNNHIFNNTFIGSQPAASIARMDGRDTAEFLNNVVTNGNLIVGSNPNTSSGSPDFNVYANGGPNAFTCAPSVNVLNVYGFSQFAAWQACIGHAGDAHSAAVSSAKLAADGTPQTDSPVRGAGTNLTALCAGYLASLCQDINGNPRPATGAWNAGAVG